MPMTLLVRSMSCAPLGAHCTGGESQHLGAWVCTIAGVVGVMPAITTTAPEICELMCETKKNNCQTRIAPGSSDPSGVDARERGDDGHTKPF